MDINKSIDEAIKSNPIMIFIKGTPDFPQCGFSAQVCDILKIYEVNFGYLNVLENPDVRASLPKYSNWPTFPQIFVNGELVGGCDIITDLHNSGELAEILNPKS